ncbi:hypothetical protein [Pseudomonas sp. TMP25]|uniref:hypothetical protein n=1 Tax=Pseudomonas sp. TMP25 TaxID=3136561 RepID=UPI0031017285
MIKLYKKGSDFMLSRKLVLCLLCLPILSACGKSVESICNETNDILKSNSGSGYTDVGMLGCLNQTQEQAIKNYEAVAAAYPNQAKPKEQMSRDELSALVDGKDLASVISILGNPAEVEHVAVPRDWLVGDDLTSPFADMNSMSSDQILSALASDFPGVYILRWGGVTHDKYFVSDEKVTVIWQIKTKSPNLAKAVW